MGWCTSVSLAFIFFFFYVNLRTHRSAIKADPLGQRMPGMPWENCRAVSSHQLPHVSCGAGADGYTMLMRPKGRFHGTTLLAYDKLTTGLRHDLGPFSEL